MCYVMLIYLSCGRWWRSQLPKLASMVMPNVTLLELTFSMEKSSFLYFLENLTWTLHSEKETINDLLLNTTANSVICNQADF